jgi:hypothetical protein
MATPKLNRLAQTFMRRIQDPIALDGGSPEKFLPGTIIRTVAEIEQYLHLAGQQFFDAAWKAAQPMQDQPGSVSHKNKFLNTFPELFTFRSITVPFATPNTVIDLTTGSWNDVHDILDSVKSGGGGTIEVWDQSKLADCLSESDPFYSPPRITSSNPGMILSQPYLYLFPINIGDPGGYTFTLNFILNLKDRTNGDILRTGGTYDVPYSEQHLTTIAELAAGIYNKDDFQEDAGG